MKMYLLLKMVVFHCYVSLPEGKYIGGRSVLKHVFIAPTARFAFDHAFAIKGQGTVLTGARVPDEMGLISRVLGVGR